MRLLTRIIFVFFISISFFSCSKKNLGSFNNSYQRYQANEMKHSQFASENIQANTNNSINHLNGELSNDNSNLEKFPISPVFKSNTPEAASEKGKLTKEERKAIKKDIKQIIKSSKNSESTLGKGILVLLAILLPPLAVALVDGISGPFWLSLILTILFYVPGLIYALYRIFKK